MTLSDITRRRLWNQQITRTRAKTPAEVVAGLGAMQAQDYAGAKWAIGLRLPNATEADIDKAIDDRIIVRTWPMRGTLHFVAAADVRWMLEWLTPRVLAGSVARQKQLGLDDAVFSRCKELFAKALQGGKRLTRDEMRQTLEQGGVPADGQRTYHILWRVAQEGLLCFASNDDKQPTFVLLDDWIPPTTPEKRRGREEALAELAERYFTSHGPATLQDFCRWAYLSIGDARAGLEAVKSRLTPERVEGETYWTPPETPLDRDASDASPIVHLLPGFDEYMLGYGNRSAALDSQYAQKICPGKNGIFMPTIVIDGRVAGTWKRTVKKQAVVITPFPFAPLTDAEENAFHTAVQRYIEFCQSP